MKIRQILDYRSAMAIICAAICTFCLLKYFQPAEAIQYDITGNLSIPSIDLKSDVAGLSLEDGKLDTPKYIVGSYTKHKNTTLLIGHSNTVFSDLKNVQIGEKVIYNNAIYNIYKSEVAEKTSIVMKDLLSENETDTLILMTCHGQLYGDGDASHRLLIFASRV